MLNIGLDVGILTDEIFTGFVLMALVNTFLTTPLVWFVWTRRMATQSPPVNKRYPIRRSQDHRESLTGLEFNARTGPRQTISFHSGLYLWITGRRTHPTNFCRHCPRTADRFENQAPDQCCLVSRDIRTAIQLLLHGTALPHSTIGLTSIVLRAHPGLHCCLEECPQHRHDAGIDRHQAYWGRKHPPQYAGRGPDQIHWQWDQYREHRRLS